jgi:hypothetical protein
MLSMASQRVAAALGGAGLLANEPENQRASANNSAAPPSRAKNTAAGLRSPREPR